MPMDKNEYSENWNWISKQVRERNHGRCELCFAKNGLKVIRPIDPIFMDHPWEEYLDGMDYDLNAIKITKIVLTVHHINRDKKDNSEWNLISLCQACHLRLDFAIHIKNGKKTREKKKCESSINMDL